MTENSAAFWAGQKGFRAWSASKCPQIASPSSPFPSIFPAKIYDGGGFERKVRTICGTSDHFTLLSALSLSRADGWTGLPGRRRTRGDGNPNHNHNRKNFRRAGRLQTPARFGLLRRGCSNAPVFVTSSVLRRRYSDDESTTAVSAVLQ
jgi:hypothetical protein